MTGNGTPTGTVTFLFSDIEGSTRLVRALGLDRWTQLLERHRAIIREALSLSDGYEVQTEGDSFFVVFDTPQSAVATAAEMQRRLSAEEWPEDAHISVRIGIHTGLGVLDADGSYVGSDVHRAARISAAAHGGQILISEATRALLGEAAPSGTTLHDLGPHRLRDLSSEHLSQVSISGLRNEFPALRDLDRTPNNLPTQLTSFVGRETELAEIGKLLAGVRHLTLTGPGGTGKTRLSLQVAAAHLDDFEDGVWFVELETIRDPSLVALTIAKVLGVNVTSDSQPGHFLADWIGTKKMLLVLDNFEQVLDAAPLVSELLRSCPSLKVICTSRAPLKIAGEQEYDVPGLPTPPDLSRLSLIEIENLSESERHPAVEALSHYEAVRLFIARAAAVQRGFEVTNENAPAVAQICAHLRGMPLAIELAAARTKLLSPQLILERLENKLSLLRSGSRDVPARQQTLRGAIEWSYDLISREQQTLASRLAVFNGGWDLDAAEAVANVNDDVGDVLEGLSSLVDQSLVKQEGARGTTRFELFPVIREFLREVLEKRGEISSISDRHAAYYLKLAEEAMNQLHGDDQKTWMDRLEREHDNMRAAIDWAISKPDPDTAIRLAFALWRFWQQRGYVREARARLEDLLSQNWQVPGPLRARLLEAAGGIAYWQADQDAASSWYGEALAIWRAEGVSREIANAIYNYTYSDLVPVLHGTSILSEEAAASSIAALNEALEINRQLGDRMGEGNVIWALGGFTLFAKRLEEATAWFEKARAIFADIEHRTMEAWTVFMSQLPLIELGDVSGATGAAREALRLFNSASDLAGVAMSLRSLSALAVAAGDQRKAGLLFGSSQKLLEITGAELIGHFEGMLTAHEPSKNMDAALLASLSAEGAKMALSDVVGYALQPDEDTNSN